MAYWHVPFQNLFDVVFHSFSMSCCWWKPCLLGAACTFLECLFPICGLFLPFFLLWLIFEYWLFRWFNAFEAGLGCKATIIVLQDLDLKTSDPPSTKPICILVGYLIGILKNLVWEKWRSLCHGLWNNIYTNWVVFHPFSLPKKSSNWSLGTAEFWRPEVKYRNACREPAKRWFL